jgi:ubiquinone/menaquinone biosynthesis C-methylase UbiE
MNHAHHSHAAQPDWDPERYDHGLTRLVGDRFKEALIKVADVPDGCDLLDVGCGTGRLLALLAERHNFTGHGVDASEAMLARARAQLPGLDLRLGDAAALPYPDESMDRIVVTLAFHHFPDQAAFAREAGRVLRPGGRLYIEEPRWPGLFAAVMRRRAAHHAGHTHLTGPDDIVRTVAAAGLTPASRHLRALAVILEFTR